jgi:hypothetical protein
MGGLKAFDSPSAFASTSMRNRDKHLPREKSHLEEGSDGSSMLSDIDTQKGQNCLGSKVQKKKKS